MLFISSAMSSVPSDERPLSRRLRVMRALGLPRLFLAFTGSDYSESAAAGLASSVQQTAQSSKRAEPRGILISVGGRRFSVTLADTQAARELAAQRRRYPDVGME